MFILALSLTSPILSWVRVTHINYCENICSLLMSHSIPMDHPVLTPENLVVHFTSELLYLSWSKGGFGLKSWPMDGIKTKYQTICD